MFLVFFFLTEALVFAILFVSFLQYGNHVQAGAEKKNQEADNRYGCCLSLFAVVEGQFVQIGNQGVGTVSRVTLGYGPYDRKRVKYVDNVQDGTDGKIRTYQRDGDLEHFLPVTGSVYGCCLIVAGINTLQTGKYGKGYKWNGNKNETGN